MDIDKIQPKDKQSKMTSKEKMVDVLNKHILKKSFEPQQFSGKTVEMTRKFYPLSTTIAN